VPSKGKYFTEKTSRYLPGLEGSFKRISFFISSPGTNLFLFIDIGKDVALSFLDL
jgi:hypothetical protein